MARSANNPQTILGFDFGVRRIGVAIGNDLTRQARPLTILESNTREARFQLIHNLLQQWQPDLAIVGLPTHADGTEQYTTRQARRFANQLNGRFGLSVILVDERYSSAEARNVVGA